MHHSSEPSDELKKLFSDLEADAGDDEDFSDLSDKMREEAERQDFGETGRHPGGSLNENDEGELRFGVTNDDGKVILNFGKPVHWIGMTPDQADALADVIYSRAVKAAQNAD